MSDMLNQRRALAKLRAELEEKEGRMCRQCGRFGHLAQNCKSGEKQRKKMVAANRFETLGSQVMQCRVRKMRRQKVVREEVKCFGCREKGHKKWECPNIKKKRQEVAAPPQEVWKKMKEHSEARGLPSREARMSMEGWTTR